MADDQSKLDFLKKFEELFDSKIHSDLTIAVGNIKFHAHQNILKLRTSFFEKATSEESGFAESKDNTVTIEDHSTHAVWRILRYCYTGDYSDESSNLALGEEDDLGALKHCRVHALADMLEIPPLKAIAAKKLETKLTSNWVTADFPGIVKEVYSTTNTRDHEVRNVLIRSTKTHLNELLPIQEFKDVMFEFGEFSGGW
ncbi:BTB/POZ protein [Trichophaea hybrida]|nr:BTB/POZ protein [Trichophaea hybrida]